MPYPEIGDPVGITNQEQLLFAIDLGKNVKFIKMGISEIPKYINHV